MRSRKLTGRVTRVPGPRAARRKTPVLAAAIALLLGACATHPRPVPGTDDPHLATAYRVLSTTPLMDGHNDLPWRIRGETGGRRPGLRPPR